MIDLLLLLLLLLVVVVVRGGRIANNRLLGVVLGVVSILLLLLQVGLEVQLVGVMDNLLDVRLALVLYIGLLLLMVMLLLLIGGKGGGAQRRRTAPHRSLGPRTSQPSHSGCGRQRCRLGRRRKLVRRREFWKFLAEHSLDHLVRHSVMTHECLARIFGVVGTARRRALVGLGRGVRDLAQQLLLEMLVAHVLPERVPGTKLHITVIVRTLNRNV